MARERHVAIFEDGANEFESTRVFALDGFGVVAETNPGFLVDAVMKIDRGSGVGGMARRDETRFLALAQVRCYEKNFQCDGFPSDLFSRLFC